MKHPVLNVKKGAVIYDDTEALRASELPRPALPGSGPLISRRRRSRRGPFTFVPLLVVALGLFIVFRIVPGTPVNRAVLAGWEITLHVTPYLDRLIVGVTFISRVPPAASPSSAPSSTVRVSLPGTGVQTMVAGALEKSPTTLRGEVARMARAKKVQAEVSIGDAHATLWLPAP